MSTESHATGSPSAETGRRPGRLAKAAAASLLAALLTLALLSTIGRPWLEKYGWGRTLLNQTLGKVGLGSDADFVLVSISIDESLYDQPWKLVRWWPGRKLPELHEESVQSVKMQIDQHRQEAEKSGSENRIRDYHLGNAKSLQGGLQKLIDRGPSKFCRIQYQVLDAAHETVLRDQIFVINEGVAWILSPENYKRARAQFPD